eukprot:SAG25_NODE_104_length_15398_cov_15.424472_6_plen_129_part_00
MGSLVPPVLRGAAAPVSHPALGCVRHVGRRSYLFIFDVQHVTAPPTCFDTCGMYTAPLIVLNSDEPMTTAAVSVYKHRAAINLEEQVSSQCTLMRCLAVLLTLIFFLAKYVIDFFRRPDTCVASCLFV